MGSSSDSRYFSVICIILEVLKAVDRVRNLFSRINSKINERNKAKIMLYHTSIIGDLARCAGRVIYLHMTTGSTYLSHDLITHVAHRDLLLP